MFPKYEYTLSGLVGPVPQGVPSGFVGAKAPFIQIRGILSGGGRSTVAAADIRLPLSGTELLVSTGERY